MGAASYILVPPLLLGALTSCGRVAYEDREACVPPQAIASDPGPEAPIEDFRVDWSTANNARLRWNTGANSATFERYEIVVWPIYDCESVAVLSGDDYPHLAFYLDPQIEALVNTTIVRDLEAGLDYQAQLQRVDQDGTRSGSPIVSFATSPEASERFVLFSEEDTPGYSLPGEIGLSTRFPLAGSKHYDYLNPDCASGQCFENLRRQDLGYDIDNMGDGDFDRAFYEFSVAVDGGAPSYFSQARLWWNKDDASRTEADLGVFERFTIPSNGKYATFQIPLNELTLMSGAPSALSNLRTGLYEFTVGGSWGAGATVSLDELAIRW